MEYGHHLYSNVQGFVYLVAVIDWFSRYILSWRISISLEADFCIEALEEAIEKHGCPEIFNTDQVRWPNLSRLKIRNLEIQFAS